MRKLLIISTTFYPDPQVPAIRMTQWCRHLPKLGWRPHVLCRYYGYEATPEELAANVHPDVTLEYLDKPEAADGRGSAGGAFRNFVRTSINPMLLSQPGISSLFVPDPSIRFWRRRRQQILQRVKAIQPDVILTTSPPHSNHDIGLWLAAQTGIPWVADFRDPYLLDNRFRPSGLGLLRWHAHERFKEAVYRRAWLITHAIPNQARWTRRHLPFARERLLTLTNAFPLEMLEGLEAPRPTANARKTVLVTGTIPEPEQLRLAQAVAQLAAEGQDVQLTLLGRRPGHEAELGRTLGERLVLPGYVSHAESVRAVMQADVLVNFLDAFRSQSRLLSTKLFEYLASGNPVVCLNPSRVDRLLLWRMSGVKVVSGPSQEQLVSALREALAGKLRRSPGDVENFRREFNWPHRAGQLVAALNQLVAFPPQNVPP
ncbi:MAG TPA: glycosyltransferase, partial [Verrucomicrobiae bacterium]